jgi:hypothetical protein
MRHWRIQRSPCELPQSARMMRARRNQVNFDFLQLPFDRVGIKFCPGGNNPKTCRAVKRMT